MPTSVVKEQAADLNEVTEEPENSRTADDIINEASRAAKRKTTHHDSRDGDPQDTKRRLETLLQLETHARRAMEQNFQRVKGFGFVFSCSGLDAL